jgi:hypothetical protein
MHDVTIANLTAVEQELARLLRAPQPAVSEEREEVAERCEKVARCIYIAVEKSVADDVADCVTKAARLLRAPPQQADAARVLDEALVVRFILSAENEHNPTKALQDIIGWEVQVATDPAVNGGFALVPQQQAEPTDEQLEAMVEAYEGYQSPADQGLAQQMEGMRLALKAR